MTRTDFMLHAAARLMPADGGRPQARRAVQQAQNLAAEAVAAGIVFEPEPASATATRDAVSNLATKLYQIRDRAIRRKGMGGEPTLVLDEEATKLFLSLFTNEA